MRCEFAEEIGAAPPAVPRVDRGTVPQAGGKRVTVFAVLADLDVTGVQSNTFQLEWPPRSGKLCAVPELDRVGWFPVAQARAKLLAGQQPTLAGYDEGGDP